MPSAGFWRGCECKADWSEHYTFRRAVALVSIFFAGRAEAVLGAVAATCLPQAGLTPPCGPPF
jgi:hypothetical protein